ncbi:glycosyltransferase [bacterium]|nr:glycosyltransferase [bacterium]
MSLRIVITTTLNNNLFHAKLVPLLRSRPDLEVVVVSDRQGPSEERLKWVWPHGIWTKFGRLGGRLPLLAREVFHPRTRLVMAYSLVPHGLFAVNLGHLRRLPVYLHFIAGPAEIRFAHNVAVSDNRVILNTRNPQRVERIANKTAFRAEKIFVPGRNTAALLRECNYPSEKIVPLHSTVDPDIYYRGNEERDIDVITVAQLIERKRPIFTLETYAEILKRRPGTRFCWLGDGPMHNEFDAALDRLGLRSSMIWTTTDDVAPFYRRARVFLLPSINEGLSLSSMEAMGCGVVPVTSDCGDMVEVVRTGETGHLLSIEATATDYADAVLPFLSDEFLWQNHSRASEKLIVKEHSFTTAIDAWRKLLAPLSP